jgi:translation elongation factor P/translation initiation factor 5A
MIAATQLRPGMVVKFNNELYSVFSMVHRTPGNLRGFVQAKMRNFRSGSMMEHRFSRWSEFHWMSRRWSICMTTANTTTS